jgi:pyruvate/2-oxoglutarate dehydrogenase complex dihydrolipoamide acyltransferase (E2) component
MPKVGLTMTEGIVRKWFKKEGDKVKIGEPLVEVETDKVVTEVISESDGIIEKILKFEDEEAEPLEVLAYIKEI